MKISRKSSEFKKLQNFCENSSKKIKYSFNAYGFRENLLKKGFAKIFSRNAKFSRTLFFAKFRFFLHFRIINFRHKIRNFSKKSAKFDKISYFFTQRFVCCKPYLYLISEYKFEDIVFFSSLISDSFCTETTNENY